MLLIILFCFSKRSGNEGEATRRVKSQFMQSMDIQLEAPGCLIIATSNLPQVGWTKVPFKRNIFTFFKNYRILMAHFTGD